MSGITIDKLRKLDDGSSNGEDITLIGDGVDVLAINADGSINVSISGQSNVYAEDSAHVTSDDGNFILAVRQDTKASTAGADGDYAGLIQNSLGELYMVDEAGNALLSTIDADTSLLAGTVSGSELQVDIVAPLPAGTNNIGDVDVLSMPGIVLEDAASAGGESLMMIGGYRQDTPGSPVSADGDYQGFLFNSTGQLRVEAQMSDTCNTSFLVSNKSVDTTVGGTKLLAAALTGRREITIQNLGSEEVWIKDATGVTVGAAGNGFSLPACSSATYSFGDSYDPYAIVASGTADIKILECA